MKNIGFFLFILGCLTVYSCKNEVEDGRWDPMQWEHNIPEMEGDTVYVSSKGGEFILKNINYPEFQMDCIYEGIPLKCVKDFENDWVDELEYIGEWYSVNKDMDILKVNIQPKKENIDRIMTVRSVYLDCSNRITFKQSK